MLFVGYTFNSLSSTIECCAVEQENSKDIRHAQRKYKQKGKRSGRHKNIHTDMYFQPSQGRLFYPHAAVVSSCYNNRSNVAASQREKPTAG
jgi:hypothetical protein